MTPARRQRKSRITWSALGCIGLAVALVIAFLAADASLARLRAGFTERVVSDPMTGLAINGIDPVGYFVDKKVTYGHGEYEYRWAGVIWRFTNQGNKAAFAANPDVYMPRYGGYDPVAVSRGLAVPGNPLFWTEVGERIYLFYDEDARARFIANPKDAIETADSKWPELIKGLLP
jgi:YHS domain-containing protein